MKYIEQLSEKRVFDFSYVKEITGNLNLARETIQNYLKKGYIKRVKQNLYVTMSFETGGVIASKYEIASNITPSSFVSHHSAFEYYGFSNQVNTKVTTSSMERFHDFSFDNNRYHYKYTTNDEFVENIDTIRVSTLSKTIVDCINDIKTYDDMEEVVNNLSSLPLINGLAIMDYLLFVNKKILFNKVGLVLSYFKDKFTIDDELLNQMKNLGINSVKYFTKEKERLNKYYKEWHLYNYNLDKLVMEEIDEDL